ncbi:hypothetical protein BDF14DRAFT_1774842 [Spinellus fusiger]|nr:hypothetical protein BDF14DRAFT_1774842 [Spinellus fusiger]
MDIRVPTCPLCEKPVSVPRGEDPNIKVNQHIQNNCANPNPLNNTCRAGGCKQKLLVPMTCPNCKLSYCVKHRLDIDHACPGKRVDKANTSLGGYAALQRASKGKPPVSSITPAQMEEIARLQSKAKSKHLTENEQIKLATLLSLKEKNNSKCLMS